MARRFVALDRDGTLIIEWEYLADPQGVELLPGVITGLRHLREVGLGLVVITNQSGVRRGYFDDVQLALIHEKLHDLLQACDVCMDGIYVCPHTPDDNCSCRKPRTGLLVRAAHELGFDPRASFVVGDKTRDVELGRRVGATTFLVRAGYGAQVTAEGKVKPDYVVDGVHEATLVIERLLAAEEESDGHEA
jgi:D-glycero-D-manno-heptose 1,7-bisphosphate phosphatase